MTFYYLHFNESTTPNHFPFWHYGAIGKANHDHEQALEHIGFKRIDAFTYDWPSEPDNVLDARLDGIFAGLKINDVVIVTWPIRPTRANSWLQKLFDRIKAFGAKLVFWIDDVETWRHESKLPAGLTPANAGPYMDTEALGIEAHFIAQADGLILHSPQMRERLAAQLALAGKQMPSAVSYIGPGGNLASVYQPTRQNGQGLDYSGSLHKAQFLLELPNTIKVHVFGDVPPDFPEAKRQVVDFKGWMDPEAVVHSLTGSFGLDWAADSYPQVDSVLGEYERYNTPSKFAQYLAADEPVIVWDQSALAPFVTANHLGFAIPDLTALPAIIQDTTDSEYAAIVANVQGIGPLIRSGFYFQQAALDVIRQVLDKWHAYDQLPQ
ncbi:glycosyltransferase [Lacticaseibacillus songhuajiangensis]|uniref:glycosyltransferase n=1 Tax=Lacticaseibacillus songhuajiangensis TaxID=1296539 RepID=UPI000F77C991|nr:glycosyltransferase [Lacticaseibacillus songhuajiangensis]